MGVRGTQLVVDMAGFAALATGVLCTNAIVEMVTPNVTTVGCTQLLLEVAALPLNSVLCTQLLLEVAIKTDEPLILPAGGPAIPFGFPATLGEGGAVLASDGLQRHTRAVFERVGAGGLLVGGGPRRYRYILQNATGAEVELLRRAVVNSRGGAMPVAFRAPIDDDIGAPAVLYRIMNAADAAMAISRAAGGVSASIVLELEEV